MRNPNFYSAVYWIIENEKWEILFQKRANTGFRDWEYQLPAWHIEWRETIINSLIREMKEELDINILEQDLEIKHISHRISKDVRVYFDIYIKITKYSWTIKNAEEDKCSEIKFINTKNIKEQNLFSYDLEVLKKIENWESFSEFIL